MPFLLLAFNLSNVFLWFFRFIFQKDIWTGANEKRNERTNEGNDNCVLCSCLLFFLTAKKNLIGTLCDNHVVSTVWPTNLRTEFSLVLCCHCTRTISSKHRRKWEKMHGELSVLLCVCAEKARKNTQVFARVSASANVVVQQYRMWKHFLSICGRISYEGKAKKRPPKIGVCMRIWCFHSHLPKKRKTKDKRERVREKEYLSMHWRKSKHKMEKKHWKWYNRKLWMAWKLTPSLFLSMPPVQ